MGKEHKCSLAGIARPKDTARSSRNQSKREPRRTPMTRIIQQSLFSLSA